MIPIDVVLPTDHNVRILNSASSLKDLKDSYLNVYLAGNNIKPYVSTFFKICISHLKESLARLARSSGTPKGSKAGKTKAKLTAISWLVCHSDRNAMQFELFKIKKKIKMKIIM